MTRFLSRGRTLPLVAFLMLAASMGYAQPATIDAFEQNRKLGRGVNIIGYDQIGRSRDPARLQTNRFRLLKEAGFNSVRFNLQPFRQMVATNNYALSASWFEVLDRAAREAQAQDLRVILDLHEFTALGNDPAANKAHFLGNYSGVY